MGIPTFFRNILKTNRRVIQGAKAGVLETDYFFIDFNSLVYKEWGSISSEQRLSLSHQKIERLLIQMVVTRIMDMVNNIVRPKVLTYLSFDGPAPKAKIVQQRSRRYKSVQTSKFLDSVKQTFSIDCPKKQWDPSSHICPGTPFMSSLSRSIHLSMKENKFMCDVILSDSSIPGEGEHKILPRLRTLAKDHTQRDTSVVIYSPDGDMISLGLMTHKSSVFILRFLDAQSEHERWLIEKGFELLYCSLDMIREDFKNELTKTYRCCIDEQRVLIDYNFLLSIVGNDFVPSLPFLKIRSGGLDLLIDIYNKIRPRFSDYLVIENEKINTAFFIELFLELSKAEQNEMRKEYSLLQKEYNGQSSNRRLHIEANMTPYEVFESRYYHMSLFHPDHPLASRYRSLIGKIDYSQEKHKWKMQYYQYFCGFDPNTQSVYNSQRTQLVINYIESLVFTLRYYTTGVPSWNWCYRYRVAPLPSDVWTVLSKHNLDPNKISFEAGKPYTPFQQLMMILPTDSLHLLPNSFRTMALSEKWKTFYPIEFDIDALAGLKHIYSEAILPEIDNECSFLHDVSELEKTLSESEKKRNRVRSRLIVHNVEKNT